MQFSPRFIPLGMGLCLFLAVPLLPGCALIAGKAISTGLGSTTDVDVSPDNLALNIGAQQQFQARSKKLVSNPRNTDAKWEVVGGVGHIDGNGLFIATNPGQGQIRATVDAAAGIGNVVGKANVFVSPPQATTPEVIAATVTPTSGGPGTLLTILATVQSSRGLAEVQRVVARDPATGLSVPLVDDGIHNGDTVANDGIYTGRFTIPPSITVPKLRFGIYAEDFSSPPASSAWNWVTVNIGSPS